MDATPTLREPSQRVSPRARQMWTLEALVQGAFPTIGLVALAGPLDAFDLPWWVWVLWALVLAAYVAIVPSWRYLVHRWEVTDTAVYTQTCLLYTSDAADE